jgi:nucleoside-diphosphate-sugar epimerase
VSTERASTYAVTGSASGIGAATKARLERDGHRVVGVDLHDAEVTADLSTPEGREAAIAGVRDGCDGHLHGVVPCAGVGGLTSAELTVRLNFFGTMAFVEGIRDLLVATPGPPAS